MAETERVVCRVDELVDGGLAVKFTVALPEPEGELSCFAIAFNGDTFAVLSELGLSSGELDGLVSSGVLARPAEQSGDVAAG